MNGDAKAGHQGQLLLNRVIGMEIVIVKLALIPKAFPDQVAAVGRGVNQHILWRLPQAALDNRL